MPDGAAPRTAPQRPHRSAGGSETRQRAVGCRHPTLKLWCRTWMVDHHVQHLCCAHKSSVLDAGRGWNALCAGTSAHIGGGRAGGMARGLSRAAPTVHLVRRCRRRRARALRGLPAAPARRRCSSCNVHAPAGHGSWPPPSACTKYEFTGWYAVHGLAATASRSLRSSLFLRLSVVQVLPPLILSGVHG